jgi:DNA-binding response OmpR family regulator
VSCRSGRLERERVDALDAGNLRRKLETDPARPRHLLTELGMGYRFQP